MFTITPRLMAGAALSVVLLAGCGGSDDNGANAGGGLSPGPIAQTITDVAAYINNLIADGSDSAEPLDTSLITLVANDDAEPAPLP